jgi:hypothetical protein
VAKLRIFADAEHCAGMPLQGADLLPGHVPFRKRHWFP